MPTRTFIGFIFLVFAMLIASTPALLDPLAVAAQKGLSSAGVPGMDVEDTTATRAKREDTGTVKDALYLKGYEVGENDMQDIYAPGDREGNPMMLNGRTVRGSERALLPGYTRLGDPSSPPVQTSGGVLLDKSGCPVFRENLDLPALWKDPAQQKKYLDKAASSDDPGVCRQRLEALVNNASTGTGDQALGRDAARLVRADRLTFGIMMDTLSIMGSMFPETDAERAKIFSATAADAKATPATTATADA